MDSKFKYDSNYRSDAAFTRIKFGNNIGVLETELNEMQILQEQARASLTRRLVPSGFIESIQKEFTGAPIICNPIQQGLVTLNSIAIAPFRAVINGNELNASGNFLVDGYNNYILVDLGNAPDSGWRDDLVYLEVWYSCISGNDNVKQWGYDKGKYIGFPMIDPRIKTETSNRIAIHWDIRVKQGVDFNEYPDGFGYHNIQTFSPIFGIADGSVPYIGNYNMAFANANNDIFKNAEFYKDNNLWVAGRPGYAFNSNTIFGNYVYALPLFRIKRRNKNAYSLFNTNGSISYNGIDNITTSASGGDLSNGIRPDKLYYDFIDYSDIVDLRKTINAKEFNSDYYLDKGLQQLIKGQLQTKDNKQLRRVQFGNQLPKFDQPDITFSSRFNESVMSDQGGIGFMNPEGAYPIYKPSLNGNGLFIDGSYEVEYNLTNVQLKSGTIDMYMQPFWHGADRNNQTIFSILDANRNLVFKFEKVYNQDNNSVSLLFSQFHDVSAVTAPVDTASVDLSNTLLLAKNIYHVRLSWSSTDFINYMFIYINGKLYGQGNYSPGLLTPEYLILGAKEDISDGCVIENLIIYNKSFEITVNDGDYIYVKNDYWSSLPKDVINSNAIMYPSFNSLLNTFSDNACIQKNTIMEINQYDIESITVDDGQGGTTTKPIYCFMLNIFGDLTINAIDPIICYDHDGNIINGTWTGLGLNTAIFRTELNIDKIIAQFSLNIPSGKGGYDLPNEMLAAGIINDDGTIKEISFDHTNDSIFRFVPYVKPRRVSGFMDRAYDYPINRQNNQAYARLLTYYLGGNNTNEYIIPFQLYGYDVIGIVNVVDRKVISCTREINIDGITGKYRIILSDKVFSGDAIEVQLALGGLTFDYQTQNKNLISNIHQAKLLEFTADGNNTSFTIPCFDVDNVRGGVLKAVLDFTDNNIDGNGVVTTSYNVCFANDSMFYNSTVYDNIGNPIGTQSNLATFTVGNNSYNSPFLHVTLGWKPPVGTKISIAVLVSYQPAENEILSLWYDYIPYQGILSTTPKQLKRISDWKYFITTLSSGSLISGVNDENIYSLNNVINRLPGGLSYAYTFDGDPITLVGWNEYATKSDANKQLIFVKDVVYASKDNDLDNWFFELNTDFSVYKSAQGFQDGKIVIQDINFKVYLRDCDVPINKYTGMACLVMDELGQIMMFVIGHLNEKIASTNNEIIPEYGDLFQIPGKPVTIQQN